MDFMGVKQQVRTYLEGRGRTDIHEVVNGYLGSIYNDKERLAREAKQLLSLLQVGVGQPYTQEQAVRFGNVGTIAMGTHYAYPLLITVLGYWIDAECSVAIAKNLGEEERKDIRADLERQMRDFDVYGREVAEGRQDHHLNRLYTPPPPPPASAPTKTGFFRKAMSLLGL